MARILLGVTGGVAAFKAVEVVRLATTAGHAVRVVQTTSAQRFVGAETFAALSGALVLTSQWDEDPMRGAYPGEPLLEHTPISHLELVRRADVFLIAPASANTIAKLAAGLADNLLTTAALAATCPVIVAPAMNNHMYASPATQANLETLRARGMTVLEPGVGALASRGEWGIGRMPEPAELLRACEAQAPGGTPRPLDGLSVLITAGGTREPIDSVRYIGNRSSGRMGWALADEAASRGANVTVIAANVGLPPNPLVTYRQVETAAELEAACAAEFDATDVLLMAAAVADFRPGDPQDTKIKKGELPDGHSLHLEPTSDVLSGLSDRRKPGQTIVGFAAEHGPEAAAAAYGKLERKRLDLLVVNDIARDDIGFDSDHNEVTLMTPGSEPKRLERRPKRELAGEILDAVVGLRESNQSGRPHATA